MQKKQQKIVEF